MRIVFFLLSMIFGYHALAQVESISTSTQRDSVLDYNSFLKLVEAYHPVSLSANFNMDIAERNLMIARGGFDPLLYGNYRTKEFGETDYYTALNAGLEIPTWMGITVRGGYEDNQGQYLNPENTVPGNGLINAGITAQLGSGLLMDSRRAALRQAQISIDLTQAERQILLNRLFVEASTVYFEWALAAENLVVTENALSLAATRYEATKVSFEFGDLPAIDTTEAYTQVLDRLYQLRDAQSQWIKYVNAASVYLWTGEQLPLNIAPGVYPNLSGAISFTEELFAINNNHPELQKLEFKIDYLNIDRRLASEYLRPKIELKYNFLSENAFANSDTELFGTSRFFENNYNFGAKVSFPLFIREARGKLGMTKIKIDQTGLEFDLKQAQLNAKLSTLIGYLANLSDQISFYEQNIALLERMRVGEEQLFENGESSLFLVNARETKLIDAEMKYNALLAKERIVRAEIREISGQGFFD
ncbi:TolC family protein [Cryomorpha ignava]|uniref:TolC family protein n=1 Tax=Cryomorpha ignava TaxID=101383 RepID=A0A7K3WN61_9FLAO|nr:TolC family protein [Cryomorpha ignava]NEN23089.1 TolC family protein [Cryomorpha ignava]